MVAGCLFLFPALLQAGEITPALERAMAHRGSVADTSVIVRFEDPLDPGAFTITDRRQRNNRFMVALKANAERHRAAIASELVRLGAQRLHTLWLINGLSLTLPANFVPALAALPGVGQVDIDAFVQGGRSQRTPVASTPTGSASTPEAPSPVPAMPPLNLARAHPGWNLKAIHAPEVWAMGHTGKGVVVATLDTGVDPEHPDLKNHWRGGNNSWFDPHGEQPTPDDALGHGTQSLGVVLGGPDMGVAPEARWIAARLYNGNGRASMSDIHRAFEWLMDPDGDPATVDAPDVVNASWALTGRAVGSCIMEFSDDIQALRAAGIAVVFAAGNDGPFPNTSNSPGNNPGVISVGAIDGDQAIARQSSRGPSACDKDVFPRLVAPGVNIRTTDLSHGGQPSYTTVSGSSLAAPHAAGVLALLAGAFPSASVRELEDALIKGAQDLGEPGKDQLFGYGRVDALGALRAMQTLETAKAEGSHPAPVTP